MTIVLLVLLFQERVSIEADDLIRHTPAAEKVADSLGDQEHDLGGRSGQWRMPCALRTPYHRRKNIGQSAGQLKHDDYDGHGDPRDAAASESRHQPMAAQQENRSVAHPSVAAAPKKAYVPGVIHGASGAQTENQGDVGFALQCPSVPPQRDQASHRPTRGSPWQ